MEKKKPYLKQEKNIEFVILQFLELALSLTKIKGINRNYQSL